MALTDKYINPFTDFGFKKLFGTEPNKDLLIHFLNQLLPDRHKIDDLSYTDKELLPFKEYDRKAIFDIYCTNKKGEKFIVEIQRAKQNFFKDRSIYYASFPIQKQAKKGEWNYELAAVYTVGILDFIFEEDKDNDVLHFVQLKDQWNHVFYDKLTFIYLEMPKFTKKDTELETEFDKWMYVFKNLHRLEKMPQKLKGKIFEKLFGEAELANLKPQEVIAYEESLKVYRDLKAVTDTAYEDGYKDAQNLLSADLEEERKQKEEAIKKQEEAIKKQEEAIKKQEEAIRLLVSAGVDKLEIADKLKVTVEYIDQIMKNA